MTLQATMRLGHHAIRKNKKTKQQLNKKKLCKFASSFSITCAGESSSPFHFPNAKSQASWLTSCIQTGHQCQPELGQYWGGKKQHLFSFWCYVSSQSQGGGSPRAAEISHLHGTEWVQSKAEICLHCPDTTVGSGNEEWAIQQLEKQHTWKRATPKVLMLELWNMEHVRSWTG